MLKLKKFILFTLVLHLSPSLSAQTSSPLHIISKFAYYGLSLLPMIDAVSLIDKCKTKHIKTKHINITLSNFAIKNTKSIVYPIPSNPFPFNSFWNNPSYIENIKEDINSLKCPVRTFSNRIDGELFSTCNEICINENFLQEAFYDENVYSQITAFLHHEESHVINNEIRKSACLSLIFPIALLGIRHITTSTSILGEGFVGGFINLYTSFLALSAYSKYCELRADDAIPVEKINGAKNFLIERDELRRRFQRQKPRPSYIPSIKDYFSLLFSFGSHPPVTIRLARFDKRLLQQPKT